MIKNEAAFQKTLSEFVEFADSGRLKEEERDYKEQLINALGPALSMEALESSSFLESLRQAVQKSHFGISNLTHFTIYDDFKKYLEAVPQERIQDLLKDLYDEKRDLGGRIDQFQREVDSDYKLYLERPKSMRWLVSVLLVVRYPGRYAFYRPSIIKKAQQDWRVDLPQGVTNGEKYVAYLDLLREIQERLSRSISRPVDLIDAHSLLWFNYNEKVRHPTQKSDEPNRNSRLRHMIVNITWQSDYWENAPSADDMRISNHEFVASGNLPYERWNFNPRKHVVNGHKIGFFQTRGAPRGYSNGQAIVFFYSRNYIVGLYGKAESGLPGDFIAPDGEEGEFKGNLKAPLELSVRWKEITRLPVDKKRHFGKHQRMGQGNLIYIDDNEAENIIQDAIDAHADSPEIQEKLRIVKDVVWGPKQPKSSGGPKLKVTAELNQMLDIATHTRNILLYGPPGTGKTYLVQRFAHIFLRPQTDDAASADEQRIRIIQGLNWYQALALTMALKKNGRVFKVKGLQNQPLMQTYASLKKSKGVHSLLWSQLQTHTDPSSKTVGYAKRLEPFLFDKNEESEWSLTPTGREYVNENLSDELEQLRNPAQREGDDVSSFYEFVTFHQSFAYEEFVEGIKPITDEDGSIRYEVLPGLFRQICTRAELAWQAYGDNAPKYLLVIDEINRANIAKVFGELITLIEDDKRLGQTNELEVRLPYSNDLFGVPPNLYILGTMNTADRSIALLDLALRRRFSFVEIMPDPLLLDSVAGVDLKLVLTRLNKRIALLLDRDHQIGHSYFLSLHDESQLHFAWYNRVVPLLQEYFYNDSERLYALLGDGFLQKVEVGYVESELAALIDADSPRYELKKLNDKELVSALDTLVSSS